MPNLIQLPASYNFGTPQVVVDVYSATDNLILLGSTTGVIAVKTNKDIRDRDGGKFSILLAPGGPNGVNDPNTWAKIITPFSLVVISMKRSGSNAVVMIGAATTITETQEWNNRTVARSTMIEGLDLFLYFRQFAYYVLKFLGILDSLPELFGPAGNAVNPTVTAGTFGNPGDVGIYWYQSVMMGTDEGDSPSATPQGAKPGVLSNTYINYNKVKQKVRKYFSSLFEEYTDFITPNITIPLCIDFLMAEGDFMSKFTEIFPFPFYEFFTMTAPQSNQVGGFTLYPKATAAEIPIQSSDTSVPPASTYVISRVNPLPWVAVDSMNNGIWENSSWLNLPTYDFTSSSFIKNDLNYNLDEVRNFYVVSPMSPLNQNGTQPSSVQGAIQQMGFMFDFYSITRYGFRPEVDSVMWWADALNTVASTPRTTNSSSLPGPDQFARAISKVSSYYEPTPNMINATVEIPLWPEVIPGNIFRYRPFKSPDIYLFYIEGVNHIYEFGGDSKTVLTLTRGY